MRKAVYGALALLWVIHTDFWFWNDSRLVWGLPVGLGYHLIWTLAVTATFALAVKYAWPEDLETASGTPTGEGAAARSGACRASIPPAGGTRESAPGPTHDGDPAPDGPASNRP